MHGQSLARVGRLFLALFVFSWLFPLGIIGTAAHAAGATPVHTTGIAIAGGRVSHSDASGSANGSRSAPASQAAAAPSLQISPSTVTAGDTVAITGTNFMANEPVEVQLVIGTKAMSTTYTLVPSVTTSASGTFTATKISIPQDTPAGTYAVLAIALSTSSNDKAQAMLTVQAPKPTLNVNTATFAPNDTITVSGSHFGKGETITFSLAAVSGAASVPIGQTKTDDSGAFSNVSLHVPFGVPAGKLQLVATGNSSNLQATTPVTVHAPTAGITLSSASALPGDKINISGSHFQPGETVTVSLVTLSSTAKLGTTAANQAGQFTLSNVAIPADAPQGTFSVVATGSTSNLSATAQIKIGARAATLTPSTGTLKPGSAFSAKGSGFIPGETISIVLSGGKLTAPVTLGTVVAGTDGSFSISTATLPASIPAGSYTLTASGQTSGRSATTTLTVQAPPTAAPVLSLIGVTQQGHAYVVSPGGFVQIAGSSFDHGAPITLVLTGNGTTVKLAVVTTSSAGTFGPVGLTIPAVTGSGAFTLEAQANGGKVASLPLQVVRRTPHISVSTGTLVANHTVTVHGTGFAPGEQIVLALSGAALPTTPSTVLANPNGAFSASFVVPQTIANGANTLTVTGVTSRAIATQTLHAHLGVASRWYFANGDTTGSTRTVITVLNPSGTAAHVKLTFLYQAGPEGHYTQTVPAHGVASVDLALAAGSGRHVSTILEADQKVSATSTISYGNADAATTAGASGPAKLWYLAEGYDNNSFSEELVVMNPSAHEATVDVRFLPFNNHPVQETRFVMQPHSNIAINAAHYIAKQSFSTVVTADQAVVVERAMHFGANGRGVDDKIGVNSAATVWDFAYSASASDTQTFFTILNPNQASPAAVTATFFDRNGKPVGTKTIVVDALHRGNIKLNDVLPSAKVATVLTSNVPVVVERPIYQSGPNLGAAPSGGVAFGRNGGGFAWAFPSLQVGNGNAAHLYLFNPGVTQVTVQATFYAANGATGTQNLTLPANSDVVLDLSTMRGLPPGAIGAILQSTNKQSFVAGQTVLNTYTKQFTSMQGMAQ